MQVYKVKLPGLVLCFLMTFAMSATAQIAEFEPNVNAGLSTLSEGSINGTILDSSSQPASNVRVELHDAVRGNILQTVVTSSGGTYQLQNVPRGNYEVVAISGLNESRERVSVMGGTVAINLRFDAPLSGNNVGGTSTVSVSDYKVPDKARDALRKAQMALQSGKLQEVAQYTGKALAIYPQYGQALTLNGLLKLQSHNFDGARQDLEKSVQVDPGQALAYFLLAASYNEAQRYDDALRTTEAGLRLAPEAWQGYFETAKALLGKNQFLAALQQVSKAIDRAPSYPMLHLVKGDAYAGLKDYANAIVEMESYLSAKPQGATAQQVRAAVAKMKILVSQAPAAVGDLVVPAR